jgi:hypothetical protein
LIFSKEDIVQGIPAIVVTVLVRVVLVLVLFVRVVFVLVKFFSPAAVYDFVFSV